MICDDFTAERIGLAALLAAIAPVGDFGRRYADRFVPYGPGDETRATTAIAEVMAIARAMTDDGVAAIRSALRAVPDPAPLLARARGGDVPSDVDLYELSRFVASLARVRLACEAGGLGGDRMPPDADDLRALLAPGQTSYGFALAHAFDPRLAPARAALDAAQGRLDVERNARFDALAEVLGSRPHDDEFVVLRDAVAALPRTVRIVRETPTYYLCTLVLDGTLLANTRDRDAVFDALANIEEEVRARLGDAVAAEYANVLFTTDALGALDCFLARVAFAQRYGGCTPRFAARRVAIVDATFVPLRESLAAARRPHIPIALAFDGTAVLTGPNMGGKSAALATCAFLILCAMYGVPPPAASATLPLPARIAWLGGESSSDRGRLLSSFGADVVRAASILRDDVSQLILIDEFARTTGPREGRALVLAFVRALVRRGSVALVATHFDGIADAAEVTHLAVAGIATTFPAIADGDLTAALDALAAAMDYRIVAVGSQAAPRSDALALAALLGMDAEVVADARREYER